MADAQAVIVGIQTGDYDGHEIEIVNAVRKRVDVGAVKAAWRIKYDGLEITEEDLTIAEAKLIRKITDESWAAPLGNCANLAAFVVSALVHRKGLTIEAATEQVDAEPIKKLLGCLTDYTVSSPPKDSAALTPQ